MAREWTPEERREYLSSKFFDKRKRVFLVIVFLLIFSLLTYITYFFYSTKNIVMLVIFLIITAVFSLVLIFSIDHIFYGAE